MVKKEDLLREKIIAFVVPRYGVDVLGGAESGIKGWAEALTNRGFNVEVLTTCTRFEDEWVNFYPEGVEKINNVVVRRFATDIVDRAMFYAIIDKANHGEPLSSTDLREFVNNNLRSTRLLEYLQDRAEDFSCVIFTPFPFGLDYYSIRIVAQKAILLPCLHDEPLSSISLVREMLEMAAGIFFNTTEERDWALSALGLVNSKHRVIGYGFSRSHPVGNKTRFQERSGIHNRFLLYSGRLDSGKNLPLLFEYFRRYKKQNPDPLKLLVAGEGSVQVPRNSDIIQLGFIQNKRDLADLYASADALCQPSIKESFSIVLMEAWLERCPVLVNSACPVTSGHVKRSGGGEIFRDFSTFSKALRRMTEERNFKLAERGRAYVIKNYSWDIIIPRILEGILSIIYP